MQKTNWTSAIDRDPTHKKLRDEVEAIKLEADIASSEAMRRLREYNSRMAAWESVLDVGRAAADRVRYVREQIAILEQRRALELAAFDADCGDVKFSKTWFEEHQRANPLADHGMLFQQTGGQHPHLARGVLLAGCDAGLARMAILLAAAERAEADCRESAAAYAKASGFEHSFDPEEAPTDTATPDDAEDTDPATAMADEPAKPAASRKGTR